MADAVHPVDEVIPLPKLFALGLQHVLVMYANAVAVPLILGELGWIAMSVVDTIRPPASTKTIDSGIGVLRIQ